MKTIKILTGSMLALVAMVLCYIAIAHYHWFITPLLFVVIIDLVGTLFGKPLIKKTYIFKV